MQRERFRLWGAWFLVPALVVLIAAPGCGGKKRGGGGSGEEEDDTTAPPPKLTAVDSKGWGWVEGTVTVSETPPPPKDITDKMETNKAECLKGDLIDKQEPAHWQVKDKKVKGA